VLLDLLLNGLLHNTDATLLFVVFYHDLCLHSIGMMPTKIFVGRLAEGTSSEDIRSLFRKFGAVTECDVISNYGFVVSSYLC